MNLKTLIDYAYCKLAPLGKTTAEREAWLFIEHYCKLDRLALLTKPETLVERQDYDSLEQALQKRLEGMPLYRILGERDFYGRRFHLSKATLEPREDTEVLVEESLPFLQEIVQHKGKVQFLDFGTGTGIIAITLLCEVKNSYGYALDVSQDALKTAISNAQKHNVYARFTPILSDGFSHINQKFDVILSNPPYIPTEELASLAVEVQNYDPKIALDGGKDGLNFYRLLAQHSKDFLYENGLIIIEIGFNQKQDVTRLFQSQGYRLIKQAEDLQKIPRLLIFSY